MALETRSGYRFAGGCWPLWISTAERLPPERQDVLVWNAYHGQVQLAWRCEDDRLPPPCWLWQCTGDGGYEPHHITHWMPLPEAPQA